VGDEPFAVLLGDVIMESPVPATRALIEIYEATGQGAITVQEVPREELQFYGVISASPGKIPGWGDSVLRLNDMIEKPKPDEAPSNLGVSGRYVLPPEIFDYLEQTKPGAGGEIQLTDGLRALAAKEGLWAHVHQGKTHDAGNKLGFLKATVELALKNPKFGNEFRRYLKTLEP
jgi:UTP--glucose-1-phosphate uridylyltransferase